MAKAKAAKAGKHKGKPSSDYDETTIGEMVQTSYGFIEDLFDPNKRATIKDAIWACEDDAELRDYLATKKIFWISKDVHIMVVDIETADIWPADIDDEWRDTDWYTLVLPPVPRRKLKGDTREDYADMQAWAAAWYHATNDGYGM